MPSCRHASEGSQNYSRIVSFLVWNVGSNGANRLCKVVSRTLKLYPGTIGVHQAVAGQHYSRAAFLLPYGKSGLVPMQYLITSNVLSFSDSASNIINSGLSTLLAQENRSFVPLSDMRYGCSSSSRAGCSRKNTNAFF